jgi:hypothetical protein
MKLCPFCHTWVSENIWHSHLDSHTRLLPDGQMQDHVTVRPEERFAGSIAHEPQWYVHPKCGEVTGMPDEIVRSYLADPFLYNDTSFCTGCGTYVPTSELFWQETNESLLAADRRRKWEFVKRHQLDPSDFVWDAHGPVMRKSRGGGAAGWGLAIAAIGGVAAVVLVGFVVVLGLIGFRAQARAKPAGGIAPRPVFSGLDIPQAPDLDEIMREHDERMEQIRRQNDELLEKLRSESVAVPPRFDPPVPFETSDPFSGLEEARRRSEEAHQRAHERMEAARERFRHIP